MPNRRLSTIPEQRGMEELGDESLHASGRDKTITFTAAFYLFVIVAAGIPVWIKTTTPVRFSLPDIPALMVHAQMMAHRVPVTIVATDGLMKSDNSFISSLEHQLSNQWPRKVSTDGSMSFTFSWKVRSATKEETDIINASQDLTVADKLLSSSELGEGEICIFLVHHKVLGRGLHLSAGLTRMLFLSVGDSGDEDSLAERIFASIEHSIEPSAGESLLTSAESGKGKQVRPQPLIDPNISMWLNFVMEDPLDGVEFQSTRLPEVQAIVDTALSSSGLNRLLNLKITSQMVYYAIDEAAIDAIFNKKQAASTNERLIDIRNVPVLITSIENRVVEPDNKQSFFLNIIIPSSSQSSRPLLFWDESEQSKSNLLLTASEAGFLIWNQAQDFNLAFKLILRKLIGLHQVLPSQLIRKNEFFALWELDSIKRSLCQKQVLKSLSSLESIEKLLGKVSNIVIGQQVSERMHEAVELSHKAIDCLASGKLDQAYDHSCRAFQLSESAFYDPSLLALLYFPDDQKYAVYLPLFGPVGLALAPSVYHLLRNARRT